MITPAFGITATERVLPKLALDFTTASLDPRITFTRTTGASNPATYIDSSGVITAATNNQPRFDYDPVTLVCKGLLIEESRTNSLLNSDTLSTQSVTVTAAARTLSFYGTGQVVLSGAYSATVTGNGAYPTRTTLTFTPSAGTLTLTVTGTVQYAQLEAGAFATSYIPTTTTALTRNADVAKMTGTNFSDWYSSANCAIQTEWDIKTINTTTQAAWQFTLDGSNRFVCQANNSGGTTRHLMFSSGSAVLALDINTLTTGISKDTVALVSGSNKACRNAGTVVTNAYSGSYIQATSLELGSSSGGGFLNGWLRKFNFYTVPMSSNEVKATSKL